MDAITTDCLALREQVTIYEEQLAAIERQHEMVRLAILRFVNPNILSKSFEFLARSKVGLLLFRMSPLIVRKTGLWKWRLTGNAVPQITE